MVERGGLNRSYGYENIAAPETHATHRVPDDGYIQHDGYLDGYQLRSRGEGYLMLMDGYNQLLPEDEEQTSTEARHSSSVAATPESGGGVDWNFEFYDHTATAEQREQLMARFVEAAQAAAVHIISEMFGRGDTSKRTSRRILGGNAGGMKFIYNKIFLKVSVDLGLFGGNQFAIKCAGHEAASVKAYTEALPSNSIRTPLTSLIDYCGFRVIAQALLPIDGKRTLVLGSCDGGVSVATDPRVVAEMKNAAQKLNLKGHIAGPFKSTRKLIYGPGDIEIHAGTDGHFYALDLSRLFPPESPVPFTFALFVRCDANEPIFPLEIGLVRKNKVPIEVKALLRPHGVVSHMFGAQGLILHHSEDPNGPINHRASAVCGLEITGDAIIYSAARSSFLYELLRPELVKVNSVPLSSDSFCRFGSHNHTLHNHETHEASRFLCSVVIPAFAEELLSGAIVPLNSRHLSVLFHERGINMRHLGSVRACIPSGISTCERIRSLLLSEMVGRSAKHLLKARLRENSDTLAIIDFFEKLFGGSSSLWDTILIRFALKYGRFGLPLECKSAFLLRAHTDQYQIFYYLQQSCGLQIPGWPVSPGDHIKVCPTVKSDGHIPNPLTEDCTVDEMLKCEGLSVEYAVAHLYRLKQKPELAKLLLEQTYGTKFDHPFFYCQDNIELLLQHPSGIPVPSGAYRVLLGDPRGNLISFGKGTHGRLGLAGKLSDSMPTVVLSGAQKLNSIHAGGWWSAAIDQSGVVYGWGANLDQMGHAFPSSFSDTPIPLDLGSDEPISRVICVCDHKADALIAVTADGRAHLYGVLAGSIRTVSELLRITNGEAIADVGASGYILTEGGRVLPLRKGFEGVTNAVQLCVGINPLVRSQTGQVFTKKAEIVKFARDGAVQISRAIGRDTSVALTKSGLVCVWYKDEQTPQNVPELSNCEIVQVAAGIDFFVALSKNGQVYTWGSVSPSVLGRRVDNTRTTQTPTIVARNVRKISVGSSHTLLLSSREDGEDAAEEPLVTIRSELFEEMHPSSPKVVLVDRTSLASSSNRHSLYSLQLRAQATSELTLRWNGGKILVRGIEFTSLSVSSSFHKLRLPFCCLLTSAGELFVVHGKKPTPLRVTRGRTFSQICCGGHHVAAISEGALLTWGSNEHGQLGHDDVMSRLTPRSPPGLHGVHVKHVDCGNQHTLCCDVNGTAYSFGRSDFGVLGLSSLAKGYVAHPRVILYLQRHGRVRRVAAGASSSFCVMTDGKCYAFGNYTALGLGINRHQSTPRQIKALQSDRVWAVSAGFDHTLFKVGEEESGECGVWQAGRLHNDNYARVPVVIFDQIQVLEMSAGVHLSNIASGEDSLYEWSDTRNIIQVKTHVKFVHAINTSLGSLKIDTDI